jgi:hypothetical protein
MANLKVPLKYFDTKLQFQEFIDKEKEWMYNRIFEAIKYAHENGHDEASILEAKIGENMSVLMMNSERSDWENSLNLALTWYEKQENYERCSDIAKILSEAK